VASATAQLGDTHGQWGLVPIWGMSVRLPERVGRSRAKQLMFTSRRLGGEEAAAIGLVDTCVPDGELDPCIESLTGEIVANSWGTNRRVKQLLADSARLERGDALGRERQLPYGMPEDTAQRMARPVSKR
jgi:enoyl-CoA hydratase/carnithine racemase